MLKKVLILIERLGLIEELADAKSADSIYAFFSENNVYSHLFRMGMSMIEIDNTVLDLLKSEVFRDNLKRQELLKTIIAGMGDSPTPLELWIDPVRCDKDVYITLFPEKEPEMFTLAFGPISRKNRLTILPTSIKWDNDGKELEIPFYAIRAILVENVGTLTGFVAQSAFSSNDPKIVERKLFYCAEWHR